MILPADAAWSEGAEVGPIAATTANLPVPSAEVNLAAKALRSGEPCALLVGGGACTERSLVAAARIAAATGAKLLCETFPARLERGAGLPAVAKAGARDAGVMSRPVAGRPAARGATSGPRRSP